MPVSVRVALVSGISIHPLRAERDRSPQFLHPPPPRFQSTRSVRSGTKVRHRCSPVHGISIHPLRAERDPPSSVCSMGSVAISIHPLRAERDSFASQTPPSGSIFQSTRSVRSGTTGGIAPVTLRCNFNPPAPCGAGPQLVDKLPDAVHISIHPLRAERDGQRAH